MLVSVLVSRHDPPWSSSSWDVSASFPSYPWPRFSSPSSLFSSFPESTLGQAPPPTRPQHILARLRARVSPIPTLLPFTSFHSPRVREFSVSSLQPTHKHTNNTQTLTDLELLLPKSNTRLRAFDYNLDYRVPSPSNSRLTHRQLSASLSPTTQIHFFTLDLAHSSSRAQPRLPDTIYLSWPLSLSPSRFSSPTHTNIPCFPRFLLVKQPHPQLRSRSLRHSPSLFLPTFLLSFGFSFFLSSFFLSFSSLMIEMWIWEKWG